jgi:hypothetical protein
MDVAPATHSKKSAGRFVNIVFIGRGRKKLSGIIAGGFFSGKTVKQDAFEGGVVPGGM